MIKNTNYWICCLIGFLGMMDVTMAQEQFLFKPKFGLRAGASFTSMFGPQEAYVSEEYKTTVRLSAGGTVRFALHERFGLAAEVVFVQKGAFYGATSTNAFLRLPAYATEQPIVYGYNRVNDQYVRREDINFRKRTSLNIVNGYIEVPILFYYEAIDDRLQFDLGVGIGFLIDSKGRGTIKFGENSVFEDPVPNPGEFIEMDLDYRMLQDEIGAAYNTNSRSARIDGTTRFYPSGPSSYYFTDETDKNGENVFNTIDFTLQAGVSYYFTPGLRLGARFGYSLMDITNTRYDYSELNVNADGTLIQRDDFDGNIGVQVFVGLQF